MVDQGVVVWVTGPSDEMTARVARAVSERLVRRHLATELITTHSDGAGVLAGEGIDRRVAFTAAALVRHGVVVVVAVPSPARAVREELRKTLGRFIEIYVPVGHRGPAFEPPEKPEVQVDFPETELESAVERTLRTLELLGYVRPADDPSYSAEEERQVINRLKSFGYL